MDLKEIEAKIRAEHPLFAALVDRWPHRSQEERQMVWELVCAGYDLGFMRGTTYGLEQHAKTMEFALGKIFGKDPLDKGFNKE